MPRVMGAIQRTADSGQYQSSCREGSLGKEGEQRASAISTHSHVPSCVEG